jgi:ParB/RepB/Spo0J family partition protein
MSATAAAWRFDRLTAEARDAAEKAAARAGTPLAAWLERLVAETAAREGVELPPPARDTVLTIVPAAAPAAAETTRIAPRVEAARREEPAAATPAAPQPPAKPAAPARPHFAEGTVFLAIEALHPPRFATRRGEDVPPDLLSSIATSGLRQPLLVRAVGDGYEIVAGARRWRAAERIGLGEVPALVAALDDAHALLGSLAENLQRGDLPPLDEARAYLRLLTEFGMTAAEIIRTVGRDRQHVVRAMRLLGLPARARALIESAAFSLEECLRLLDSDDPDALAAAIAAERSPRERRP